MTLENQKKFNNSIADFQSLDNILSKSRGELYKIIYPNKKEKSVFSNAKTAYKPMFPQLFDRINPCQAISLR